MKTVDIIIPSYKPDKTFVKLIEKLERQTIRPSRIIVMNTEQQFYDSLAAKEQMLQTCRGLEVHHLALAEYDHGNTRHLGVQYSDAEYFVAMTQDAVPEDDQLIEHLLRAMKGQPDIAVAYARQMPRENAGILETYARGFNYPEQSMIKTAADLPRLGIKTYFCSNVCAMYRRDIYERQGGFIRHTIFNEDMIFAAGAIGAGYGIAYAADARVIHSHDYNHLQQFRRNFDLAVSQADHPEIFAQISSESEGMKMVKQTISYLCRQRKILLIPHFVIQSGAKFIGYKLGKQYQKLPRWMIRKCTGTPAYWKDK